MKRETVLPCSFRCTLRQCPSFARAVPLVVEAATRPTRMPAPLLGANAYEAAAASLPFTPAN